MQYKQRLRNIITNMKQERCYVEEKTLGGIIIPLIKMMKYDVFIYGCGGGIFPIVLYLRNNNIKITAIIDKDEAKVGKYILDSIPIIHSSDFINHVTRPKETFVLINTVFFFGIEQMEILKLITDAGINKIYEISSDEKHEIKLYNSVEVDEGRIEYYRKHIIELESTLDILGDTDSKEIMIEYIRAYMECGIYHLPQCDSRIKYLYGKTLDSQENNPIFELLYKHLDNEVWLNCGSNIGDTIFQYFSNGLNVDKIYAFEGDKKNYSRLCANLQYLPSKYLNKIEPHNEYINETTDFNKLLTSKVTLINADIEGAEYELLKNIISVIKRDRPVLAICAYHRANDLTDMIAFLNISLKNYHFLLRKYESGIVNVKMTAELVLYAIPAERKP